MVPLISMLSTDAHALLLAKRCSRSAARGGDATEWPGEAPPRRKPRLESSHYPCGVAPRTFLGRYRVERPLGAGSFATVWLARDDDLQVPVAVKVLAENWCRNADMRRRFVDEARVMRQIESDHVARVFTIDELDDGRPYFVMEWADRGTLYDRVTQLGGDDLMSVRDALHYALEIAKGLAVVHAFGVVHRDIKPSNVLFRSVSPHLRNNDGRSERVLLGDFGLAKNVAGSSAHTLAAGTPAYCAPEQTSGASVIDHRADLYALTVVLYELLVGSVPFAVANLRDNCDQNRLIPAPSAYRRGVSQAVDDIVQRGLAVLPNDRFADCNEFIAALEAVADLPLQAEARVAPAGLGDAVGGVIGRTAALVRQLEQRHHGTADLRAVRERLLGPGRVLVLAADLSAGLSAENVLAAAGIEMFATSSSCERGEADSIGQCDVLVLAGSVDDFAELESRVANALAGTVSGPVAMCALIVEGDDSDPDEAASPRELGVRVAAAATTSVPHAVIDLVERVTLDASQAISVSAALAELALRSFRAGGDGAALVSSLDERIDELLLDSWRSEEFALARADVRGELGLASSLCTQVRRLVLEDTAAARLGLAVGCSDDEVRNEAAAALERWRTLIGSGRVPFRARGNAEAVVRCLERLWVIVAQS